jgi:excinuclease ABC subunit A
VTEVILRGSGLEAIEFSYFNERGRSVKKLHPFEGILNNMRRRYRETDSSAVREELARYISTQPCPDCHGTRLNEAARHVFVDEHNLPALTAMAVEQSLAFFEQLELPGKRGEIAVKIVKEINERLRSWSTSGSTT